MTNIFSMLDQIIDLKYKIIHTLNCNLDMIPTENLRKTNTMQPKIVWSLGARVLDCVLSSLQTAADIACIHICK